LVVLKAILRLVVLNILVILLVSLPMYVKVANFVVVFLIVLEVIFLFHLISIDFVENFFRILVIGHNVFYYIFFFYFTLYRICMYSFYVLSKRWRAFYVLLGDRKCCE
jgi:hypothetical protein